jgi:hypothetical protein
LENDGMKNEERRCQGGWEIRGKRGDGKLREELRRN